MRAAIRVTAIVLALGALPAHAREELAAGDRAWEARATAMDGRLAAPDQIEAAIRAYRAACEAEAAPLDARWRLLRGLHYLVEFTSAPERRKNEAVADAASLAKTWVAALGEGSGPAPDRAQVYFWSAIARGPYRLLSRLFSARIEAL